MKIHWLALALLSCPFAVRANGQEMEWLGTTPPGPNPQSPSVPGRGSSHHSNVSGGSDSCGSATLISGSGPFVGDTLGSTTDGPSNCGSLSNDVWYDWVSGFTGTAEVSLCGSAYDSVVSVYDGTACLGPLLACNDDYCGLQSRALFPVTSGNAYKIQIGGFLGAQGSYTMTIMPPPSCPCSGAPPEGEGPPCGIPSDSFNGGCNSTPNVYSVISVGGTVCGNGAFDGSTRDTDWYQFTLTIPMTVTWTVTGEYPVVAALVDNNCPPTIYDFVAGGACTPTTATATIGPGTFVAFAAPDFVSIVVCGVDDSYHGALVAIPGVTICEPGVAGVLPCPCGNPPSGLGRGCDNSSATGGATLTDTGVASIAADTVVFTTTGEKPTALSIVLQGTAVGTGLIYGDGVRCVLGVLKRLYTKSAVGGSITAPAGGDPSVHVRSAALGSPIPPGATRYYQVYYRDPFVFGCMQLAGGATFNISSGRRVYWNP